MNQREIARLLDVSAVQATSTRSEVAACAAMAAEYHCKAVFCLSCFTTFLTDERERLGGEFLIGGTVGYPSGQMTTAMKGAEARLVLANGAEEIDMMMNIGFLKSGMDRAVLDDMKAVREITSPLPMKVIIETPLLTDDEIDRAANLVIDAGADWIKTGTGWTPTGTTMEHLRIIRSVIERRGATIGLKAAGGVRSLETLLLMHETYGVGRFGVGKSAKKILDEIAETE